MSCCQEYFSKTEFKFCPKCAKAIPREERKQRTFREICAVPASGHLSYITCRNAVKTGSQFTEAIDQITDLNPVASGYAMQWASKSVSVQLPGPAGSRTVTHCTIPYFDRHNIPHTTNDNSPTLGQMLTRLVNARIVKPMDANRVTFIPETGSNFNHIQDKSTRVTMLASVTQGERKGEDSLLLALTMLQPFDIFYSRGRNEIYDRKEIGEILDADLDRLGTTLEKNCDVFETSGLTIRILRDSLDAIMELHKIRDIVKRAARVEGQADPADIFNTCVLGVSADPEGVPGGVSKRVADACERKS